MALVVQHRWWYYSAAPAPVVRPILPGCTLGTCPTCEGRRIRLYLRRFPLRMQECFGLPKHHPHRSARSAWWKIGWIKDFLVVTRMSPWMKTLVSAYCPHCDEVQFYAFVRQIAPYRQRLYEIGEHPFFETCAGVMHRLKVEWIMFQRTPKFKTFFRWGHFTKEAAMTFIRSM